jgi:hypothetical protein
LGYSRSKATSTTVRIAFQFVLQDGKVRGAVGGRRDEFAVDNGAARADVPGVGGDLLETVGPVVSPCEYLGRLVGEVDQDAIAVELDFVDPPGDGTFSVSEASAGSMNSGKGP